MKVYWLNYKNYANCEARRLTTISGYTTYDPAYVVETDISWKYGDGVDTYAVAYLGAKSPDYCVVTTAAGVIDSRWYVLDGDYLREGKSRLILKRDVVADKWDDIKNDPFYAVKGIPSGKTDPLIVNPEGQRFNQVLVDRVPLTDYHVGPDTRSTSPIIIGYLDKSWRGGRIYRGEVPIRYENPDDFPLYKYATGERKLAQATNHSIELNTVEASKPAFSTSETGQLVIYTVSCGGTDASYNKQERISGETQYPSFIGNPDQSTPAERNDILSAIRGEYNDFESVWNKFSKVDIDIGTASDYNGKRISIGAQTYDVTVTMPTPGAVSTWPVIENIDAGPDWIVSAGKRWAVSYGSNWSTNYVDTDVARNVEFKTRAQLVIVTLTAVTPSYIDIPSNRYATPELPYNIFALTDTEDGRTFAGDLASQLAGAGVLYDIQVWPYPVEITSTGQITISAGTTLSWVTDASGGGTLEGPSMTYTDAIDIKISAITDTFRILSPDGTAAYDFSPALNGGIAQRGYHYKYTLRPLSPYLQITPFWDFLYGDDSSYIIDDGTGESRGLICKGAFSLPYSTDAWATYQIQHSSYADAINRQIDHASMVQDYERASQIAGVITSAIGAAGGGAFTGAVAGPVGAVAGGVIGGVGSAIAGAYDVARADKMRTEQLDYIKDMQQMSMRNIQAMPHTLSTIGSNTVNSVPTAYVEIFSATDEEETILRNQIKYEGCTYGAWTTLATMASRASDTMTRFVSGILRHTSISDDAHMAAAISAELQKGVYLS